MLSCVGRRPSKTAVTCLQVGKFCYNRKSLLEVRGLIAHHRMPTGWRAVQPEDEFVLKTSQALPAERSWQPGARRLPLPPRELSCSITDTCLNLLSTSTQHDGLYEYIVGC